VGLAVGGLTVGGEYFFGGAAFRSAGSDGGKLTWLRFPDGLARVGPTRHAQFGGIEEEMLRFGLLIYPRSGPKRSLRDLHVHSEEL
jgi:hypothetical protein